MLRIQLLQKQIRLIKTFIIDFVMFYKVPNTMEFNFVL